MPHTSQIGRPMPAKNSSTSGAIGAAPDDQILDLVEAELGAQRGEQLAIGTRVTRPSLAGTSSPAWRARVTSTAASSARSSAARRCPSGSAAKPASRAALSFSHTRGTAPHEVGSHLDHGREHLGQIGDERHGPARYERE